MSRKKNELPDNVFTMRYRAYIDGRRSADTDFTFKALEEETGINQDRLRRLYKTGVKDPMKMRVDIRRKLASCIKDPILDPDHWERASLPMSSPGIQEMIRLHEKELEGYAAHPGQGRTYQANAQGGLEQNLLPAHLNVLREARTMVEGILQGIDTVIDQLRIKSPEEYRTLARDNPGRYLEEVRRTFYSLAYAMLAVKDLNEEDQQRLQELVPKMDIGELSYLLQNTHRTREELEPESRIFDTKIRLSKGPYKIETKEEV